MWRSGRDLPTSVQIEELDCHLLNCRACLVALRRPPFSTECVQSWWRRLGRYIGRGSISLDLIDAIEGHVESITPLVLDHRDFDRALAHVNLLDAPVDAHAVLEVHHVVAGLERGKTLQSAARRVAPCTAKPALTAEDFVVGEYPIAREIRAPRRNDEAAV